MTVSFAQDGPENVGDDLRRQGWHREIERLLAAPDSEFEGKVPDFDDLTVDPPFETVFVTVKDLAEGNLKGTPARKAWRSLLRHEGRPVAQVEFDAGHHPVAVHFGPAKRGIERAIEIAQSLEGDFEAQAVEAPGLKFYGLRARSAGDDLIVPYEPNATALHNYEPVPTDAVMAQLKERAEEVLRQSAEGEDTGG